jgi:hypothetical protein
MVNWETSSHSYQQAAKLLLWAKFTERTSGISKLTNIFLSLMVTE